MFPYVCVVYYQVSSRKDDLIYFDEFSRTTREKILQLRAVANDDVQLAAWWRSYFEEEPPFGTPTLPFYDHKEPAQKS